MIFGLRVIENPKPLNSKRFETLNLRLRKPLDFSRALDDLRSSRAFFIRIGFWGPLDYNSNTELSNFGLSACPFGAWDVGLKFNLRGLFEFLLQGCPFETTKFSILARNPSPMKKKQLLTFNPEHITGVFPRQLLPLTLTLGTAGNETPHFGWFRALGHPGF